MRACVPCARPRAQGAQPHLPPGKPRIDKVRYVGYLLPMPPRSTSARIFRALGDERRLQMLEYVARNELDDQPADGICSCHIQAHVGLAQPTVSHHMKLLVDAGLITGQKRGKWVYYRLNPEGFAIAESTVRAYAAAARSNQRRRPASRAAAAS